MSNMYRISAHGAIMIRAQTNEMTHALTTKMQGAKLKNSFDVDNHTITVGLDYSLEKLGWRIFIEMIYLEYRILDKYL